MARGTTNETVVARAFEKALNVLDLAPFSVAYMMTHWSPELQKRFWQIAKEFMQQTPITEVQEDIEKTIGEWHI